MNLAFPALLVLLLVLPGLIFRYSYARGAWGWSNPISFRSVSDELAYGVVFAVGLHGVWTLLAGRVGYAVDFGAVLALLLGNFGQGNAMYEREVVSVTRHPGAIASYFLSLCGGAWLLGNRLHWAVRKAGLDHRTRILRFKNEWYYLLSGEVLAFHDSDDAERDISGVYLPAVVDHAKASYLYRGIVADWTFDKDGQLDTISLRLAHRRLLDADLQRDAGREPGADVKPDDRYYNIHGDRLILRYSQLKTLNLDDFRLTPDDSGGTEAEPPAGARALHEDRPARPPDDATA